MDRRHEHLERERMLREMQRASFLYFVHEVNPANGLVCDKTAAGWPASIAATGMALTAYPVGVELGFISRAQALQTTLTTLRFLMASEQSDSPTASGYHGLYYHFLEMQTGRRAWDCELSSIDTALLIAGVLAARAYFDGTSADEREVAGLADALYRRVDWAWLQNDGALVSHGWKPETGFLAWSWRGYDESLILQLLGLGSPTHPLSANAYDAWAASFAWTNVEGIDCLHAGPLFIHQMSQVWLDVRGLRDKFMRAHDCDYFENCRRAAHVQQRYAMRNPNRCEMYGEFCWGITASDGPASRQHGGEDAGGRHYYDYIARGVPDGPDDGTLAPWAVVASLPFAPEIVLPTIEHLRRLQLHVDNPYGFKASFNATFPSRRHHEVGWVSHFHFGINEGPTLLMIANHLDDTVWRLMRGCEYLVSGLRRAGFDGGWLNERPAPRGAS